MLAHSLATARVSAWNAIYTHRRARDTHIHRMWIWRMAAPSLALSSMANTLHNCGCANGWSWQDTCSNESVPPSDNSTLNDMHIIIFDAAEKLRSHFITHWMFMMMNCWCLWIHADTSSLLSSSARAPSSWCEQYEPTVDFSQWIVCPTKGGNQMCLRRYS